MNMDMQNQIVAEWRDTLNVKLIVGDKEIPILGDKLHAELKGIENLMRKCSEDISDLKIKLNDIRQLCWNQFKTIRIRERTKAIINLLEAIYSLRSKDIWILFGKELLKNITDDNRFTRFCNDEIWHEFESMCTYEKKKLEDKYGKQPIDELAIVNNCNEAFDNFVQKRDDPLWYDKETHYFSNYASDKECGNIAYSEDDDMENIESFFATLAASFQNGTLNPKDYFNESDSAIGSLDDYQINWERLWDSVFSQKVIPRDIDTHIRSFTRQCNFYNTEFLTFIQKHESIQDLLKQIESLQVDNKHSDNSTNFVIANIGFVIESNGKYEFVTFPICIDNKTNVGAMYDTFNNNYTKYICAGKSLFRRNTLVDSNLLKKQGLKDKPNNYSTAIYENIYYHSEQALFINLENSSFLRNIVSKLIKNFPQIHKVHLIVLDFHSSRYMCEPCTKSTIYMQNTKNQFLQQLTAILQQKIGHNVIDKGMTLQLLTRVSADIPHPNKDNPKSRESHQRGYAVLSNPQNGKLLCIDSSIFSLDSYILRNSKFDIKLNKYTVMISGGANDKAKTTYINVYNSIVLPIKHTAATKIQKAYRKHLEMKRLTPLLTNLVISSQTITSTDDNVVTKAPSLKT